MVPTLRGCLSSGACSAPLGQAGVRFMQAHKLLRRKHVLAGATSIWFAILDGMAVPDGMPSSMRAHHCAWHTQGTRGIFWVIFAPHGGGYVATSYFCPYLWCPIFEVPEVTRSLLITSPFFCIRMCNIKHVVLGSMFLPSYGTRPPPHPKKCASVDDHNKEEDDVCSLCVCVCVFVF